MIVKDEFLGKLRRFFNLNLYEVKIWTALLSRGVSTAGELSDIANVPRSRSYDVLESLEKKGFVIANKLSLVVGGLQGGRTRGAWEGDHLADVGHAADKLDQALKAQTKTGVRGGAISAQV